MKDTGIGQFSIEEIDGKDCGTSVLDSSRQQRLINSGQSRVEEKDWVRGTPIREKDEVRRRRVDSLYSRLRRGIFALCHWQQRPYVLNLGNYVARLSHTQETLRSCIGCWANLLQKSEMTLRISRASLDWLMLCEREVSTLGSSENSSRNWSLSLRNMMNLRDDASWTAALVRFHIIVRINSLLGLGGICSHFRLRHFLAQSIDIEAVGSRVTAAALLRQQLFGSPFLPAEHVSLLVWSSLNWPVTYLLLRVILATRNLPTFSKQRQPCLRIIFALHLSPTFALAGTSVAIARMVWLCFPLR